MCTLYYNTHYLTCEVGTLNVCANKRKFHSMFEPRNISTSNAVCLSLSMCHICYFKDRSDYNKAVLLTLPVQREAEVVALFHATVHHRHHDFLHARWCKLHCTTIHVIAPPLPQMSRQAMLNKTVSITASELSEP